MRRWILRGLATGALLACSRIGAEPFVQPGTTVKGEPDSLADVQSPRKRMLPTLFGFGEIRPDDELSAHVTAPDETQGMDDEMFLGERR